MLVIESSEAKSSTMLHMLHDELKYKNGDDVIDEDEKLWNIICNATTGADSESPKLFCVIDGLDECEEQSRSPFIELIASAFSSSGTARQPHQPPKILITSRPYPLIEERFRPLSRIRLRLENETPAISKDIETMITGKIQKLNPARFPSNLQDYLHAEISRKAGRTFLWVKLIFDALEQLHSTTPEEIRKLLDTNPSELDTLYESSLSCTKDKGRTRRLLQILIAAARPLNLEEVNVALQIRDNCVYFEDIDLEPDIESAIKWLCGSVLRITDSTVDFMHQTAKEFLTASQSASEQSQNLTWGASLNISQSHCVLGIICLRYLALEDWKEMGRVWTGRKFDVGYCDIRPREWVTQHGRLHKATKKGGDDSIYSCSPQISSSVIYQVSSQVQAEVGKSFCFYEYAGRNWPHHSEEVLQRVQMAHEAGSEAEPDFCQLQALLTSLRQSGIGGMFRCTNSTNDPFLFLEEEGFHSVVNWLLSGPPIVGYPDYHILEVIHEAVVSEKGAFILPLLQYATTIIGDSEQYSTEETNKLFSFIANAAAANCLIPVVEHLQQKAEFTLDETNLEVGIRIAVKSSDYSSTAKLIGWGAKDVDAISLII